MKRILSMVLIAFCVAALPWTSSFAAAAAGNAGGVYDLKVNSGYTLTPLTADDNVISGRDAVVSGSQVIMYENAEKFTLTYSGGSAVYHLVVMLSGSGTVPTENNIYYIDQEAQQNGSVTFTVYPKSMTVDEYHIYVSQSDHNSELTEAASFSYYRPYKPGDVDENGSITATDALFALQMSVGKGTWSENQRLAAEVDGGAGVTATDALYILQASVGKRKL